MYLIASGTESKVSVWVGRHPYWMTEYQKEYIKGRWLAIPKGALGDIENISVEGIIRRFNICSKARIQGLNRGNKIIVRDFEFRFDGVNLFEEFFYCLYTFLFEPINRDL